MCSLSNESDKSFKSSYIEKLLSKRKQCYLTDHKNLYLEIFCTTVEFSQDTENYLGFRDLGPDRLKKMFPDLPFIKFKVPGIFKDSVDGWRR